MRRLGLVLLLIAVAVLGGGWLALGHVGEQPDPDKHLVIENEMNERVAVDVRVIRHATNETVHEATYLIDPETRQTVYNTRAAAPDGVETFVFVLTARNTTERIGIQTSECQGGPELRISAGGLVSVGHVVC